jgi:hypothetical protein
MTISLQTESFTRASRGRKAKRKIRDAKFSIRAYILYRGSQAREGRVSCRLNHVIPTPDFEGMTKKKMQPDF